MWGTHLPESPITYENVEVARCNALGMWCRVHDREVFVGRNVPMEGTTIRKPGDRGRLVIPGWFVRDQGIPEP